MAGEKRKYEDVHCPHCDQTLSKTAYYEHKKRFQIEEVWQKKKDNCDRNDVSYSMDERTTDPRIEHAETEKQNEEFESDHDPQKDGPILYLLNEEEDGFIEEYTDSSDCSDYDVESDTEPELQGFEETHSEEDEASKTNIEDSDWPLKLITALRLFYINMLQLQTHYKISRRGVLRIIQIVLHFLQIIATVLELDTLLTFLTQIPKTDFKIKKFLGIDTDDFQQYVVCVNCNSIFNQEDCEYEYVRTGQNKSKKCHQANAVYRNDQGPKKCQEKLLKCVKSTERQTILRPRKVYAFKTVSSYLKDFVMRPHFNAQCNLWRESFQVGPNDNLRSIYDGKIWKDFQSIDGKPFLSDKNNLGLMLNVDWYQPFERTQYSQGAIYLTILNLPQEVRIKNENVMLVGVIPGPKEPKFTINSFLKPLVDDMETLFDGLYLVDQSALGKAKYRAALLAVSSDIPATRKVLGFYGHSAERGCSKCFKPFPQENFGSRRFYGGFVRSTWQMRDGDTHKQIGEQSLQITNKGEKSNLEKENGARYTVLNSLSYFNPVRMHLIDALHGLMIGTPKYIMKLWMELGILDDKKLKVMEEKIQKFKLPTDIGRLPSKISSKFSGFTADQWKNFTNILSLYALHDVVDREDYNMWSAFVRASRILCCKAITTKELDDADRCLTLFCMLFEKRYDDGKFCTPNMHLHLHLRETLLDYGPIHEHWCFGFERLNGVLGSFKTNMQDPTVQVMRHFQQDVHINQEVMTLSAEEQTLNCNFELVDAQLDAECQGLPLGKDYTIPIYHEKAFPCSVDPMVADEIMFSPRRELTMTSTSCNELCQMFDDLKIPVDRVVHSHISVRRAVLRGRTISVQNEDNTSRTAYISAQWREDSNEGDPSVNPMAHARPGVVLGIFYVNVIKNNVRYPHILLEVGWLKAHPDRAYFGVNSPVEVWSVDYEQFSPSSFIPIQYVQGRVALLKGQIKLGPHRKETVCVTVTMP